MYMLIFLLDDSVFIILYAFLLLQLRKRHNIVPMFYVLETMVILINGFC